MEAIINNNVSVNSYWNLLKGLSKEMKLELISKLSSSLVDSHKSTSKRTLHEFFGCMKDASFPSSEEIDEALKDEDIDINKFLL